jgi:hypothetical protein
MLLDLPPKAVTGVMSEIPRTHIAGTSGIGTDGSGPSMFNQQSDQWQDSLNSLIRFGLEGGRTDEDDLVWPTEEALVKAYAWLQTMRNHGSGSLPDSIVPDGEGGIVLERSAGQLTERLEIAADGATEYLVFRDCRLVNRVAVSPV